MLTVTQIYTDFDPYVHVDLVTDHQMPVLLTELVTKSLGNKTSDHRLHGYIAGLSFVTGSVQCAVTRWCASAHQEAFSTKTVTGSEKRMPVVMPRMRKNAPIIPAVPLYLGSSTHLQQPQGRWQQPDNRETKQDSNHMATTTRQHGDNHSTWWLQLTTNTGHIDNTRAWRQQPQCQVTIMATTSHDDGNKICRQESQWSCWHKDGEGKNEGNYFNNNVKLL